MTEPTQYNEVALMVTHYNRSQSLERLLKSFEDLDMLFGEVVVSDDGSQPEHISYMRELQKTYSFNLVTTPKNKGLGNNLNKGQNAVTKPLTLYVQEDFVPQPIFKEKFEFSLKKMEQQPSLDLVRYYSYFKYPYLEPVGKGFSKMDFGFWKKGYKKFYLYSDHPHLRRSTFFNRFGEYPEGIIGDKTEYQMMMSLLVNKAEALYFDEHKSLFHQVNSEDEPSTMDRSSVRFSKNLGITLVRHLYRHIRFNYNYLIGARKLKRPRP